MIEQWEAIQDYPDYMISSLGSVKSFRRYADGRIMKSTKHDKGYRCVRITNEDGVKNNYIHRLVATAFIDNPLNKITVNHKNGIKDDNSVGNLEWNTYSENNKHSYDTGLKSQERIWKSVIQMTIDGIVVGDYESQSDAERQTGINRSNIGSCAKGERNNAGGFVWEFKNI
jgi:hypothetical protein